MGEISKAYVGSTLVFGKDKTEFPVEVTTTGTVETATDGDDTIYTFKSDGTITFSKRTIVDVLVVGAGGSGKGDASFPSFGGGGGGGGEVLFAQSQSFNGEYDITRGTGASAQAGTDSIVAQNSTNILVANGGGYNTSDGGSGAGGNMNGTSTQAPGDAVEGGYKLFTGTITSNGNNGGTATTTQGGGGGGAGAVGGNAPFNVNFGGKGGNGIANSITGTSVTYGGGGGGGVGGSITGSPNNGGTGGGGDGASANVDAQQGTDYLGGGGGGETDSEYFRGGHGVVIFRVPNVAS